MQDTVKKETREIDRDLEALVQERTQAARGAQLEAERLAESLLRSNQQLAIINSVAAKLNGSLDLDDILSQALEEVLRLAEVDAGAIFLRQETLGNLELCAYRGLSEEAARVAAQMGLLDGSCGGVTENQQIVVVPDIRGYRGRRAESLKREHLCTLIHVPLIVKGFPVGSMCVGTRDLHEFATEEQNLLTAIAGQIAMAVENARLYAELAQKERLRGELLRKVISVQEEERKRIARELHDETSQALTALLYAGEEAMEGETLAEVRATLNKMCELARGTLDNVHKLIFDLRPSMLDHLGLVPALRWLAEARLEPAGVRVTVEEVNAIPRLSAEAETALFRTVQEAITNVARHSRARNVEVFFNCDGLAVTVTVTDDGVGFDMLDMTLSPDSGRGLGLAGMQERMHLLGGTVDISSAPASGTTVSIRLPCAGCRAG